MSDQRPAPIRMTDDDVLILMVHGEHSPEGAAALARLGQRLAEWIDDGIARDIYRKLAAAADEKPIATPAPPPDPCPPPPPTGRVVEPLTPRLFEALKRRGEAEGYRFEVYDDGRTERLYRPDGSLVFTARRR